jgi:hypothetical protein
MSQAKVLLLLTIVPCVVNAQLKEFEISNMERPDVAVVQCNTQWPDDALLLVYSSLEGLQFRSSMGVVDKQIYNNQAGRYEILVKPIKQMIFVSSQGFIEKKTSTINPNAKDVFYYQIEQKIIEQIGVNELKSLVQNGALNQEQFEYLINKLIPGGVESEALEDSNKFKSEEWLFRRFTEAEKKCEDIDGNKYQTVQIGGQLWMAENLRTTHYGNGDDIAKVKSDSKWSSIERGAFAWYNDERKNDLLDLLHLTGQ